MKRKRFTDEQVIGFINSYESGLPVADLARQHGFSDKTFYNWKSKYGGMEVSDAKRLRDLEGENSKLKKLLAETMLDKAALEAALQNKW
jgi:putative transposase